MSNDNYSFVQVILDSADPDNFGTRDTPEFDLLPAIEDAEGINIVSARIPFSYYAMDVTCNSFIVTIPDEGSINYSKYTVYFPPGTHKKSDLPTIFDNILAITYNPAAQWNGGVKVENFGAASGSSGDLASKYDMKLFLYGPTSKMTIYSGDAGTMGTTSFRLDFRSDTSIKDFFGFISDGVTTGVYTSEQANIYDEFDELIGNFFYVEAPNSVQLNGPSQLYIQSNLAQTIGNGAVRTTRTTSSLLYGIKIDVNSSQIIMYDNPTSEYFLFTRTSVSRLSFRLQLGNRTRYCPGADSSYFDANNNPIYTNYLQLQGLPFQLEIKFKHTPMTLINYNLTLQGDRVVSSESTLTGAKVSHQTNENRVSKDVLSAKDRRVQKPGPPIRPNRTQTFPMQPYRKNK